MVLLKHGDFEFGNILKKGYILKEDEPEIISEVKMADRSIKRNYGDMPKTKIKIKFDSLDRDTLVLYLSHLANNEDEYTYFSFKNQEMITKKFFINLPEISLDYISNEEQIYDEFEIELEQCSEVI